jgi:hypothetical protein
MELFTRYGHEAVLEFWLESLQSVPGSVLGEQGYV